MLHGHFVWADLSALTPAPSRAFYTALMGWDFVDQGGDYHIAHNGRTAVAGHFLMPDKFKDMGLPPFWMPYIAVADIDETVALATGLACDLGGRVEIPPSDFATGGKYALIRDPLGAGFTVYQGPALGASTDRGYGLFVSDAAAIIPFYEALFGWTFRQRKQTYEVFKNNAYICDCQEAPDHIRGDGNYWLVHFPHDDLDTAQKMIVANSGQVAGDFDLTDGPAKLIHDPDGAAFMLLQKPPEKQYRSYQSILALSLMLIMAAPIFWLLELIFLVNFTRSIKNGQTSLLRKVYLERHPAVFWLSIFFYGTLLVIYSLFLAGGISYAFYQ